MEHMLRASLLSPLFFFFFVESTDSKGMELLEEAVSAVLDCGFCELKNSISCFMRDPIVPLAPTSIGAFSVIFGGALLSMVVVVLGLFIISLIEGKRMACERLVLVSEFGVLIAKSFT